MRQIHLHAGRSLPEFPVFEAVWKAIEGHCSALDDHGTEQPSAFGLKILHTDSAYISQVSEHLQAHTNNSVDAEFLATLEKVYIKRKSGSDELLCDEFQAVCRLKIKNSSESNGSGLPEVRILEFRPGVDPNGLDHAHPGF